MTPEDIELIYSTAGVPDGNYVDPVVLLRHFGFEDGRALAQMLLEDALTSRDAEHPEVAMIVLGHVGIDERHVDVLMKLAMEDWHTDHEDVIRFLAELNPPEDTEVLTRYIELLVYYTEWLPAYKIDDSRAMAVKALRALGKIPGTAATEALEHACLSESRIVRERAQKQLDRRAGLQRSLRSGLENVPCADERKRPELDPGDGQ